MESARKSTDNRLMHPGARFGEAYTIEELVSRQGMGSIFKARDREGRLVASCAQEVLVRVRE